MLTSLTNIILIAVLVFIFIRIFRRIDRIEKEIGLEEDDTTTYDNVDEFEEGLVQQNVEGVPAQTDQERQNTEVREESVPTPSHGNAFTEWLAENWLMKLGALLVLIGVGWFVSYAFMQGWIGPQGRIALGLAFGVIAMIGGKYRAKSNVGQGGVLLGLGSTSILLTMFAARFVYGFFTPLTAMGVMLLSVSFVALASVLHKSRWLAFSSLVLACIVPLLAAGQPEVIGMMVYMAVVVVGTIWVVALTNWRYLTLGSLLATALYSLKYISPAGPAAEQQTALMFVFGFVALFAVINVVSYIRKKYEELSGADLIISIGNGLFLLIWILQAVSAEWQALTLAVWAIVFAAGSFAVYRMSDNSAPFFAHSGVAGGLVAAATAVELSGSVLTIAYTVEITILLLSLGVLTGKRHIMKYVSFLYVAPIILSLDSLGASAWNTGIFHRSFAELLLLMVVFAVSAYAIGFTSSVDTSTDDSMGLANIYGLLTTFYATALVWLVTHAIPAISDELATGVYLAIYAVAGILFYLVGKKLQRKMVRYLGLVFVWGVVARLMFVEVWAMSLVGKVITFFVVGGLFMGTALLEQGDPGND